MSLAELLCMVPLIYPFPILSGTCVAGEKVTITSGCSTKVNADNSLAAFDV